jgi:hypothetical protein
MAADSGADLASAPADHSAVTADLVVDSSAELAAGYSAEPVADRSAEQAGCSACPAADYPGGPAADRLDGHDPAGSSVADSASVAVDS